MQAYIYGNTAELRDWLKSVGLQPIDYPECDECNGLIAPYGRDNLFYNDGVVNKTDDDAEDYYFCYNEEEFKEKVLELINTE
jgi:hypothetical protein